MQTSPELCELSDALRENQKLEERIEELKNTLKIARRWIIEGEAQIGWNVDRLQEVLDAGA